MAPPAPLQCQSPGCEWQTPTNTPSWEMMLQLLQLHDKNAHPAATPNVNPATAKLERLPRPVFTLSMTEASWQFKVIEWQSYIGQTPTTPENKLLQLRAACDDDLRQRVYDSGDYAGLDTETKFLARMKDLAVIRIHKSVHLMNLYRMTQESDEAIRAFVARVMGTADMCAMTIKCPKDECGTEVSYRDEVVKQVIIHGMINLEIKQRVLSRCGNGELSTLADLIDYVSAEESALTETASLSNPCNLVSRIKQSAYKSGKSQSGTGPCKFCGGPRHSPSNNYEDRKRLCKAFGQSCAKCSKKHHFAAVCQSGRIAQTAAINDDEGSIIGSITTANMYQTDTFAYPSHCLSPTKAAHLVPIVGQLRNEGPVTSIPLPHHVHDKIQGWYPSKALDSPQLPVSFSVDHNAYAALGLSLPRSRNNVNGKTKLGYGTADTGAQLTVVPVRQIENMGIRIDSIFPVQSRLNGAQDAPIMVEGGILLVITATDPKTGITRSSHQLCYVSRHVTTTFLSLSACIDLGLVPRSFPSVG